MSFPFRFVASVLWAGCTCSWVAAQGAIFDVTEKSIPELQAAQAEGRTTARVLVEQYLARISAYDQAGPALNAIITLNPNALREAEALDRERKVKGPRGPLHGIPILVKDNFATKDMPTSGGTLALATMQTSRDAFQIDKLRQAGAIVLGKTALHELAAGITTISSLSGATRNPYDLNRVPGGSSGGTAAAVAASFAAAGMGTDTCGSIRIPAGNQNLVGLRVTRGLSSRHGVIPLSNTQDEAGPLARSVTDLALLLDATVGPDANDPVTADAARHVGSGYARLVREGSLKGKRIGVLKSLFGQAPEDAEVGTLVRKALEAMKAQGAELVEIAVPDLDELMRDGNVIAHEFKFDLARYLADQPSAPVKTLQEIIDKGLDHDQLNAVFRLRNGTKARDTEAYRAALEKQGVLRARLTAAFQTDKLDAVAYPVLRRKAVQIGETQTGFTCQLSGNSGLPAISVPAGFTDDGVPVGMELLGQPYQEAELLKLAYAWEQAAKPRHSPFSTPPLVAGHAPRPLAFTVSTPVESARDPATTVSLEYIPTTGKLRYSASVQRLSAYDVVAVTLQRGQEQQSGSVLAHLVRAGQLSGAAELTLRTKDREALASGQLYVHLYTRQKPLGAGRVRIEAIASATH